MLYKLDSTEGLTVYVDSLGGELKSIVYGDNEFLWNGKSAVFPASAPNLFPFIGRLYQSKYLIDGKEYNMNIHGFLSGTEMSVKLQERSRIVFQLQDSPETRKIYPFSFLLEIEYILNANTCNVNYTVTNCDKESDMYYSIGGHPGFLLDNKGKGLFTGYYIEFSERCVPTRYTWDSNGLWEGKTRFTELEDEVRLWLNKELFRNDAIVLEGTSGELRIRCTDSKQVVTVNYADFPYIGIWHPYTTEDAFICIEPWSGLPGRKDVIESLESKPAMIVLSPLQEKKISWSISVNN